MTTVSVDGGGYGKNPDPLTAREIAMSHTIDDLASDVARMRRTVCQQVDLLTDGLHALRAGRYPVADEYMERARDACARVKNPGS